MDFFDILLIECASFVSLLILARVCAIEISEMKNKRDSRLPIISVPFDPRYRLQSLF